MRTLTAPRQVYRGSQPCKRPLVRTNRTLRALFVPLRCTNRTLRALFVPLRCTVRTLRALCVPLKRIVRTLRALCVPIKYIVRTVNAPARRQVYRGSQPDKRAWASVDSSELVPGDVISVVREVRSGPPESTPRVPPE